MDYLIINIEPLWMMVHLLCLQSHTRHEAKRLVRKKHHQVSVHMNTGKLLSYYSYSYFKLLQGSFHEILYMRIYFSILLKKNHHGMSVKITV